MKLPHINSWGKVQALPLCHHHYLHRWRHLDIIIMSLLISPSSDMNSSSHVSFANSAHTGSPSAEIKLSTSQVLSFSWSLPISSSSSWSPTFVCSSSFSPWSISKNGSLSSDILKDLTTWKLLVRIPAFRKHFLIVLRGYLLPSFSNPPDGM